MKRSERLIEIDVLRGLAILLVLGAHLPVSQFSSFGVLKPFFEVWFWQGKVGVDLFFVLSGFLVSGLIFIEYKRHKSFDIKRFLIRRGLKIYPGFYVMIFTSLCFITLTGVKQLRPLQIISELLYLQSYILGFFEHTWSLAVEEHFYLFIAFLLFLKLRKNNSQENPFHFLKAFFIGVACFCFLFRVLNNVLYDFLEYHHIVASHLRMDGLFFGVFLSYYYHFEHEKLKAYIVKRRLVLWPLSFMLVIPGFTLGIAHPFLNTFGLSFLYLGFGVFLLLALFDENKSKHYQNALMKGIAYIGYYSYSIYLWHVFMRNILKYAYQKFWGGLPAPSILIITYLVAAILWGIIIAKLIEFPCLKLRDRLFPSRSES